MPTPIRHRITGRLTGRPIRSGRHTANDRAAALRRDLQVFASPSDLTDLAAILRQYPDDETAEIRELVNFTRAS